MCFRRLTRGGVSCRDSSSKLLLESLWKRKLYHLVLFLACWRRDQRRDSARIFSLGGQWKNWRGVSKVLAEFLSIFNSKNFLSWGIRAREFGGAFIVGSSGRIPGWTCSCGKIKENWNLMEKSCCLPNYSPDWISVSEHLESLLTQPWCINFSMEINFFSIRVIMFFDLH